VDFKDGPTVICDDVALSGNTATCSPTLNVGSYSLTAVYSGTSSGSPQFGTSTSSALTQTVNKKELTVTAQDKSITYGDPEPALTFTYSGFVNSENSNFIDTAPTCGVAGAHTNASSYTITCSGGVDNNYSFKYVDGQLTVNEKQITITPDPNQSKVYGQADPTLTYTHSPALESGDSFTGSLGRATGENVGLYAINLGTLSAGSNYELQLSASTVNFAITTKALTISGLSAQNKVYDGNTNATITGTPSLVGVVVGDDVSLSGTASGTFADPNVGNNKQVTVTGLSLAGTAKGNYTLTLPTLSANITSWNAQSYGFYSPVDGSVFVASTGPNPVLPTANSTTMWNSAKGGSTIPLKFNVFADTVEKTSLSDIAGFTQQQLPNCVAGDGADEIEVTITGNTSLRYDTTAKQWIQNWKTPTVSKETCYRATVKFADGSTLSAFFKLRK
jgi:hypothetical protein